ncbi:MAG: hypothetical protein ACRCYY_02195 [Trueperaceae bacterium]
MRKAFIFTGVLLIATLFVFTACGGYDENGSSNGGNDPGSVPQEPTAAIQHPLDSQNIQRPLIDRYYRIIQNGNDKEINSQDFNYSPRQSEFSGHSGWDILTTPWPGNVPTDNNWLTLRLNRDATLTIVMDQWATEAQQSAWLADWTKGATTGKKINQETENFVTFTKSFPSGDVTLPAATNYRYTLLLAEAGGTASSDPALAEGISEEERPQANQICPSWLHDTWQAQGPGGDVYKSWHPQIDPIYWCYYGHDHGSDPSLIGYNGATFGYVAANNENEGISQPELHEGFKGFAFKDEAQNIGWYISIHAETGVVSRSCARVHTVSFVAKELTSSKLLLELSYKGDFGVPRANNDSGLENVVLDPEGCPEQDEASLATELEEEGFRAARNIRVFSDGKDPGGYEQWDGGVTPNLGMSFNWFPGMGIDIRNPATGCNNLNCSEVLPTGRNDPDNPNEKSNADMRTIELRELTIEYDKLIKANDLIDGTQDGYFMTDVYGEVQADSSKNVIRQFMAPDFKQTLDFDKVLTTQDAWRGLYIHDQGHQVGLELENSLGTNN